MPGRPTCPFACSVVLMNRGIGHIIASNREVIHTQGKRISRPIREPLRSLIKKQFAHGASVHRVHQELLRKRSSEENIVLNYDASGKSGAILRKIKSEYCNESLLSADVEQSVFQSRNRFEEEINFHGVVKGAIHQIRKYPCQVIVYTELSIRLFDLLLNHDNVVLSWDAIGSVIKDKPNSPRL